MSSLWKDSRRISPVAHDRQADFLLHRDDLTHRPVLGGLQSGRGQPTPGVSLARVTQESRAEQAPDVLNPCNHCHNAQRPIRGDGRMEAENERIR